MKLVPLSAVSKNEIQNETVKIANELMQQMANIKDMNAAEIMDLFQTVDGVLLCELYERLYKSKEADNINKMVSSYLSVQKVVLERSIKIPEVKRKIECEQAWGDLIDEYLPIGVAMKKDELYEYACESRIYPRPRLNKAMFFKELAQRCPNLEDFRRGGSGKQVRFLKRNEI